MALRARSFAIFARSATLSDHRFGTEPQRVPVNQELPFATRSGRGLSGKGRCPRTHRRE